MRRLAKFAFTLLVASSGLAFCVCRFAEFGFIRAFLSAS